MKAMLLAAGLGTRLRPVTDVYAKPAVPFLNIPLLYYSVALMESAGAQELVANTHYKPDQIAALMKNIPLFGGSVALSPEVEKPLGSGGGVWAARKWLSGSGDFLVANADEVIIPSSADVARELVETHKEEKSLATIYVMSHPGVGTQFGGVWADADGFVHGFGKQKPAASVDLIGHHYVGLLVLSDRVFKYLPQGESNLLYDALVAGINAGEKVRVFNDKCVWYETGNQKDFLEASGALLNAPMSSLEKKYVLNLGGRFWKNKSGMVSNSVLGANIKGTASIRGFAVVGDNCVIGKNCVIEDSVLMPGAKLADGTHVRHQIVLP